jgi:hypothetical protein
MKVEKIKLILLIISLFSYALTLELEEGNLKKKNVYNKHTNKVIEDNKDRLEENHIYFCGWVKYLRYTDMEKSRPKAFFKNVEFDIKNKINIFSGKKKDNEVFILIIYNFYKCH